MWASIREAIARRLWPAAFQDAERYDYLRHRLDELQTWCGNECPEIDHAIVWAKKSTRMHFMPLAEYDEIVEAGRYPQIAVGGIDAFRDQMRARAQQSKAA